MLLKSIRLRNLLSYGPEAGTIELRPLNLIIGANGSGKSNLLEAVSLLAAAPTDIRKVVREGGGVREWLWKGVEQPVASIDVFVEYDEKELSYQIEFGANGFQLEIVDETIANENMAYGKTLDDSRSAGNDSILKVVRDNIHHPEITFLGEQFSKIQIYRDWNFGRKSPMRQSQRADLIPDYLLPDASNLALFLNTLRHDPATKRRLLTYLQELYAGIEDYEIRIVDGSVLVFFQEGEWMIPATRLSDGTLRYLYLLAILCNPNPPPLICIEEPELGLHPDILPTIAKLLVEASERTQLIVTTHSETLVDCMTETPENVLVCEKDENGTYMERLNAKDLEHWMTEYRRLGTLWNQGHIGGNRW